VDVIALYGMNIDGNEIAHARGVDLAARAKEVGG
jgi:hypothetical protein